MKCPVCGVANHEDQKDCTQCASNLIVHQSLARLKEKAMPDIYASQNLSEPVLQNSSDAAVHHPSGSTFLKKQKTRFLSKNGLLFGVAISQGILLLVLGIFGATLYASQNQVRRLESLTDKLLAQQTEAQKVMQKVDSHNENTLDILARVTHVLEKTTEMYQKSQLDKETLEKQLEEKEHLAERASAAAELTPLPFYKVQ